MPLTIPMRRSECRVWNLVTMGVPASGWDAAGFDDSAWPLASTFSPAQADDGGTEFKRFQNGSSLATSGFDSPIANSAEAVAPWTAPPNLTARFAIRWRFLGTPLPTDTIVHMYEDFFGRGFGANTGLGTMNDYNFVLFDPIGWIGALAAVTSGTNVLAIAPQCNWSDLSAGWLALALTSATATLPTAAHGRSYAIVVG